MAKVTCNTQPAPLTAAELQGQIDQHKADLHFAKIARDEHAAGYDRVLLSGADAEAKAHKKRAEEIGIDIDRLGARIRQATEEHRQAVLCEAEAARQARTAEAQTKRDAARMAYDDLDKLLKQAVAILTLAKEADDLVLIANRDLPAGVAPLDPVESPMRDYPGSPARSECVKVVRPIGDGRTYFVPGLVAKMETAYEERIVPAKHPQRRTPLYELFELPSIMPGGATYRVPGTYTPGFIVK